MENQPDAQAAAKSEADETKRIDYLEKHAVENMKLHHASGDDMKRQAATVFGWLFTLVGAAVFYIMKAIADHSWDWVASGLGVFVLYLAGAEIVLLRECLSVKAFPQIYNEPQNLDEPETPLNTVRRQEIAGLQLRITEAGKINARRAKSLNNVLMYLLLSPLAFAMGAALWFALDRIEG